MFILHGVCASAVVYYWLVLFIDYGYYIYAII
jgi:hypothetical protein